MDFSLNFPKIVAPVFKKVASWISLGIKMLPNLVVAILVLIVFWILASLLQSGSAKLAAYL